MPDTVPEYISIKNKEKPISDDKLYDMITLFSKTEILTDVLNKFANIFLYYPSLSNNENDTLRRNF